MKRYIIAGLAVDMDVSGRTFKQAAAYAAPANGPADITLRCDVRRVLELNPGVKDEDLAEYLATGVIFARHMLAFDGLYLHSSAVILDGKAYLFSAPSGTGKSTHTEKWIRLFGARYLNDDKPALRLVGGTWMAYGTPWSGKYDLSENVGVPLGGICVLRRGEENAISPMEPSQALPYIMSQSIFQLPRELMDLQLTLLDRLLQDVPVWMLHCRNDDEAALLSREVMTGKEDCPKKF